MVRSSKKRLKVISFGNFPYGRASANFLRNFTLALSNYYNIEVVLPRGMKYGKSMINNSKRINSFEQISYRHTGFIKRPTNLIGQLTDEVIGRLFLYVNVLKTGLKNDTDLIIKYQVNFFSDLIIVSLCRLFKIKYLNILSEYYPKPQGFGFQRFEWQSFIWGIKYISKKSNGLIVFSNFLTNYIRNLGYKKPIFLLPNIVDPKFFEFDTLPYKNNTITIGYTGTPNEKDGIDILLKSFAYVQKKHKNVHLLIIGDTTGKSALPKLKDQAKLLEIQDLVTFTGFIPYKDIPGLINSCDILTLARPQGIQSEAGFPSKLGEYFASKKPVVITSVGDIKNYFSNDNNVKLVKPDCYISFAEAIIDLIENPKKRELIGINGYNWMKENIDISYVSVKIKIFLEKL